MTDDKANQNPVSDSEPARSAPSKFFGNAFLQAVLVFIALAVAFSGKLDAHGTLVAILIAWAIGSIGIYTHWSNTIAKRIGSAVLIVVWGGASWAFETYLTGKPVPAPAASAAKENPKRETLSDQPSDKSSPVPQKSKQPVQTRPTQDQTGKGNVQTGAITQGPGSALSFNQQGGVTVGQINIGNMQRRISESDSRQLQSQLTPFHSKISIGVVIGVPDGLQLANQLQRILRGAGISVSDEIPTLGPAQGTKTLYGVQLQYRGDAMPRNAPILYSVDSQLGILAKALTSAHMQVAAVHPEPNQPEDLITVVIGLSPAEPH